MVRRTVPILLRSTRSSVDGRPIRTTCGTDQQVILTGVDGASDSKWYYDLLRLAFFRKVFSLVLSKSRIQNPLHKRYGP